VSELTLTSNQIKSESDALQLVSDTIKNPPQTPGEILQFAQKNFQISGAITRGVERFLPLAGSVLPLASSLFSAFASFGSPSLGEQMLSGFNRLSEQITAEISALKDYLTELSEKATLKTVDLTLEGVTDLALQESATRVMITLNQAEIAARFEAERALIFNQYTAQITAARDALNAKLAALLTAADEHLRQLYAQLETALSSKVLELLRQIENYAKQLQVGDAGQQITTARDLGEGMAAESKGESLPMTWLLVAAAGAFVVFSKKGKKN